MFSFLTVGAAVLIYASVPSVCAVVPYIAFVNMHGGGGGSMVTDDVLCDVVCCDVSSSSIGLGLGGRAGLPKSRHVPYS
jgi:hypothetical protein